MSRSVRLEVSAEASAGLLCRLIGLLAQQDCSPPDLCVEVAGEVMLVRMEIQEAPSARFATMAATMGKFVGVISVTIN